MFIIRLLRFLLGYVKFEATGVFCERFINLCSYNGIKIWGIIKKQEKICAYILARDYKKLRRIAKKTLMHPRVTRRYGLPFILRKFRARSRAVCRCRRRRSADIHALAFCVEYTDRRQ